MDNAKTIGSSLLVGVIIGAISGYFIGKPSPPAHGTLIPATSVQMIGTILETSGDSAPVCGVAALEMDDANGNPVANGSWVPGKSMSWQFPAHPVPDNTDITINAQYVLAPPIPAVGTIPATPGDSTTGIVAMNYVSGDTFIDTIPSAVPGDGDELTMDVDVVPPSGTGSSPEVMMAKEGTTDELLPGEAKVQITGGGHTWNYNTKGKHAHDGHFSGNKGTVYTVTLPTTTAAGVTAQPLHFSLFRHMQHRVHVHVIIKEKKT